MGIATGRACMGGILEIPKVSTAFLHNYQCICSASVTMYNITSSRQHDIVLTATVLRAC